MAKRTKPILFGSRSESSSARVIPQHPVLELPAHLVTSLPDPIVLWLDVPGAPAAVCISTASAHTDRTDMDAAVSTASERAVLADTIVFDGEELRALTCAAEADRLWHPEFLGLCFEKWRRADFRVSHEQALAGANPDPDATWSLARVLLRLGARLECVTFADDARPVPLHAAA